MDYTKTNAMRILDNLDVPYVGRDYPTDDGGIDGITVAGKIGIPVAKVFKTLVCHDGQDLFVFIIPVAEHLDLKKAARAASVKKVEMLPARELKKKTGYEHGGCTAIGMKKDLPTFIDQTAESLDVMNVSAGRVGTQIELKPEDLRRVTRATYAELTV